MRLLFNQLQLFVICDNKIYLSNARKKTRNICIFVASMETHSICILLSVRQMLGSLQTSYEVILNKRCVFFLALNIEQLEYASIINSSYFHLKVIFWCQFILRQDI